MDNLNSMDYRPASAGAQAAVKNIVAKMHDDFRKGPKNGMDAQTFSYAPTSIYSHTENIEFAEANIAALAKEEDVHATHYAEVGKNTFWALYGKAFCSDMQAKLNAKSDETLLDQWKLLQAFRKRNRGPLLEIWDAPEVQTGLEGPVKEGFQRLNPYYQNGAGNQFLNNAIAIYLRRGAETEATARRRMLAFDLGVYLAYNQFKEGQDPSVETGMAAMPLEKAYSDFTKVSQIQYFDNPAEA